MHVSDVLTDQPTTIVHPLAPLDAEEIRVAARAALAAAGDGARILTAALAEPDKERYLAWRAPRTRRRVRLVRREWPSPTRRG